MNKLFNKLNGSSRALLIICFIILVPSCKQSIVIQERERIDLNGYWDYALNGDSTADSLYLPGTTDSNKKGLLNERRNETGRLSREYIFVGKASYSKQIIIPDNWKGKRIRLCMERTKATTVWIDGKEASSARNISTPQWYDLTDYLSPGVHTIKIEVDNDKGVVPERVFRGSHAYVEDTQTNWNGIIGEFFLETVDRTYIEDVQVYPQIASNKATGKITWKNFDPETTEATLIYQAVLWNSKKKDATEIKTQTIDLSKGETVFEITFSNNLQYWSEFDPALYKLNVVLETRNSKDAQTVSFGMRDFKTKDKQFTINNQITFLRGRHDACVFPLTGYTAMNVDEWRHYFQVMKSYGLNHCRFHSWCPPKACFEAADREGIYLQPELPYWGVMNNNDPYLNRYLLEEGKNILNEYSNHASFVMFALGNELSGDQEVISSFVSTFREIEKRHIYAFGSNNFLGFQGVQPGEDYFTTCRVFKDTDSSFITHTRASFSFADAFDGGYLNHTYPNTVMNFSSAVAVCDVPIIGHETGQFQIYPDYSQILKYTGVLKPWNLEIFRQRLKDAGMEHQAHDFFLASGKWAVELYRADIEMNLRTPHFGGFQLLDLQDYPGQGSAYVGILDAFVDSKGLIAPEEWRQFCSDVVPLFKTKKFCWTNNEYLSGEIKIANYSNKPILNTPVNWVLKSKDIIIENGQFKPEIQQGTLTSIGKIFASLQSLTKAEKISLDISIDGTSYKNSYSFWIYPEKINTENKQNVVVARSMNSKLFDDLKNGKKVLWFPDHNQYEKITLGGLFQTDYWNFRMFKSICEGMKKPVSPGTLGLLMNPEHPVFADFPTDFHTNWQWFEIIKNSRPLIIDQLPSDYKPVVQVIDNIERNHKLAMLMELAIGDGKLFICMSDLVNLKQYPEAQQLYASIINYMNSNTFSPNTNLSVQELKELLTDKVKAGTINKLGNISYE